MHVMPIFKPSWTVTFSVLSAIVLSCFAPLSASASDEIVVLSATAMRSTFDGLQPIFSQAVHGRAVKFVYGTAGETAARAHSNLAYDLVVLPPKILSELSKDNLVRLEEQQLVGKVSLGLAVRAGTLKPDLSTAETTVTALRSAGSLGYADPAFGATTGIYFSAMLKHQNLFEGTKANQKLYSDGTTAMEALARGEVTLAAGQISEAVPVKGIDIVGALPGSLAFSTSYVAAPAVRSAHASEVKDLMKAFLSPAVSDTLKANGFEIR